MVAGLTEGLSLSQNDFLSTLQPVKKLESDGGVFFKVKVVQQQQQQGVSRDCC